MQKQLEWIQPFLDIAFVRRVRRNHGLEHATIHLLSRKVKNLKIVGRSDSKGFWLYGDVDTGTVEEKVHAALKKMQGGQHGLAIHPNCGTNLVTVALLGTAATFMALIGSENEETGRWGRLPLVLLGIMGAVILGQPVGMKLQEHITTLGDPGDLEIMSIEKKDRGGITMHRIETRST